MQIQRISRKVDNPPFSLESDNTLFYRTGVQELFNVNSTLGYDAVIIESKKADVVYRILSAFRGHHNAEFYLKPIFIGHKQFFNNPKIDELHDGYYYPDVELSAMTTFTWDVFMKSTDLDSRQALSFESEVWKRILGFFYTRSKSSISSIVDSSTLSGYTFPILSEILGRDEQTQWFHMLEWAEKQGFISGLQAKRIYVCNSCESSFLHIREVCTSCESTDVDSIPLIHHFPCAYIGPVTDFTTDSQAMTCPKCQKQVRHIGVDYDKPSSIFVCNQCSHSSQNAPVKAKCVSCSKESAVNQLIPKFIKDYTISRKGISAPISGILAGSVQGSSKQFTIPHDTFKSICEIELAKSIQKEKYIIAVAKVVFAGMNEFIDQNSSQSFITLSDQISEQIKHTISDANCLSHESPEVFYFTLFDCNSEDGNRLVLDLTGRLRQLISDNYSFVFKSIESQVIELSSKVTKEDLSAFLSNW